VLRQCIVLKKKQDQPWSAQDERQIIGQAWRQLQKKTVKVYHLLALDTTDVLMSSVARGKQEMLETFLLKKQGQGVWHDSRDHKHFALPYTS
jgi:SNF2 family DNA or RNA helicase